MADKLDRDSDDNSSPRRSLGDWDSSMVFPCYIISWHESFFAFHGVRDKLGTLLKVSCHMYIHTYIHTFIRESLVDYFTVSN